MQASSSKYSLGKMSEDEMNVRLANQRNSVSNNNSETLGMVGFSLSLFLNRRTVVCLQKACSLS